MYVCMIMQSEYVLGREARKVISSTETGEYEVADWHNSG